MKKRIAFLVVLLLILSTVLSACSGEDEDVVVAVEPDIDICSEQEIDESDTEEETMGSMEDYLDEQPANDSETMHSYEVGGATLQCRTRIEDYISDDGVFHHSALAADLGWHKKASNPDIISHIFEFDIGELGIFMFYESTDYYLIGSVSFGPISSKDPWRNDFTCRMVIEISDPENVITYLVDGDSGYRITYEQIVITAYIMENYMYNQGEDLFDWAYEKIGRREWHAYE